VGLTAQPNTSHRRLRLLQKSLTAGKTNAANRSL